MTAAKRTCPECGDVHKSRDFAVCKACRTLLRQMPDPTDADALTGGYWQRGKHGVQTWVWTDAHRPTNNVDDPVEAVMATLARTLAESAPAPMGVLCDCGCLLAHAGESCPACLLWAELDAARASWRAALVPYVPTARETKEAA